MSANLGEVVLLHITPEQKPRVGIVVDVDGDRLNLCAWMATGEQYYRLGVLYVDDPEKAPKDGEWCESADPTHKPGTKEAGRRRGFEF